MITDDESFLYSILSRFSDIGEWKFYECVDEKTGKTLPQSKKYPDLDYWLVYPDFEYYNENKLTLLVELKCYIGYFDQHQYVVAMKKKHFKSYAKVSAKEGVEVRACFVLKFGKEHIFYWENIDNMDKMHSKKILPYTHEEIDFNTGKMRIITEDYIYWDITQFRSDYENLPKI